MSYIHGPISNMLSVFLNLLLMFFPAPEYPDLESIIILFSLIIFFSINGNNGICIDETNKFICTCPKGYHGVTCQLDINECSSAHGNTVETPLCRNDGICIRY